MKEGRYRLIFKGPPVHAVNTNACPSAGNGWNFTAGGVMNSLAAALRKRDSMAAQFGNQGYKYDIRRVA